MNAPFSWINLETISFIMMFSYPLVSEFESILLNMSNFSIKVDILF
jgi:hypothetical protein